MSSKFLNFFSVKISENIWPWYLLFKYSELTTVTTIIIGKIIKKINFDLKSKISIRKINNNKPNTAFKKFDLSPVINIEKKIVMNHMDKYIPGNATGDFTADELAQNLVTWADVIRRTFYDDGIDEVISTRRLCHIIQTYAIFGKVDKAIDLCISRFDEDTKAAFLDLYTKVVAEDPAIMGAPETEEVNDDLEDIL